jgi:ketosteroid isomerase-like protein
MRFLRLRLAVVLTLPLIVSPLMAQNTDDEGAINGLIDRYGELEDASDMVAQAQLMSADRVWITQWQGRMTNQQMNMRLQQAGFDAQNEYLPGIQWFTDDRDRLVRFYGDGSVAVASFYRYRSFVLPADTPPEIAESAVQPIPAAITLVLEKQGGDWKIVHTHISQLSQPPGQ